MVAGAETIFSPSPVCPIGIQDRDPLLAQNPPYPPTLLLTKGHHAQKG